MCIYSTFQQYGRQIEEAGKGLFKGKRLQYYPHGGGTYTRIPDCGDVISLPTCIIDARDITDWFVIFYTR